LILIHRPGAHHEICRCPTRRSSDLGTESMDFSEWRSHWGPGTEVDAHADVVLWQRQWSDKRFYNLVPADFTLDRTAPGNNPAISDRKSTRLNSSHVTNSYAVFCLTK